MPRNSAYANNKSRHDTEMQRGKICREKPFGDIGGKCQKGGSPAYNTQNICKSDIAAATLLNVPNSSL